MEVWQFVLMVIFPILAHLVALSHQHQKFNVFAVPQPIQVGMPGKVRHMNIRPANIPQRQLNRPEELQSKSEYRVTKLKEEEQRRFRAGSQTKEPMPEQITVTDELYFTLEIDNLYGNGQAFRGNVTIGCFGALTPITCLNFVSITRGFRRGKNKMSYKNGVVTKIVRDFMIQMGDTNEGGSQSIFGRNFADESFAISHNQAGWVGMANFGQDSNGSQFYVLLRTARWLDGKHVVFGKVLHGMDLIQQIGNMDTDAKNSPIKNIKIVKCGSLKLRKPYILTSSEFSTDGDVVRTQHTDDEL